MSGGLLWWHCTAEMWRHSDAEPHEHWQQPCDGQRRYVPSDALAYYRAGGPPCPSDSRHGPMGLFEDFDAWRRVPVGGRGRP